jgi:hypothetical protein
VQYRRELNDRVKAMPKIEQLCSNLSSVFIYHLISTVYAGCLVFRYFDGEVDSQLQ